MLFAARSLRVAAGHDQIPAVKHDDSWAHCSLSPTLMYDIYDLHCSTTPEGNQEPLVSLYLVLISSILI